MNRTSGAASLLALLACALVVMPPSVQGRRGRATETDFAPAKSKARFRVKSMSEAMAWLREITVRLTGDPDFKVDSRSLQVAIALLGAEEVSQLLDNPDYWPGPPYPEGSWARWKQLVPLRDALLERLGGLDPALGLRRFPAGAHLILRAAAAIDGPGTLTLWLESREAWRSADRPPLIDSMCQWIEGVGEIPTITPEEGREEDTIAASLLEGWASGDADAAWEQIFKAGSEFRSPQELTGFVKGLPEGSDWGEWAAKLQPIPWQVSRWGEVQEEENPVFTLARRWIKVDPDAAVGWLRQQDEWRNQMPGDDSSPVNPGRIPTYTGQRIEFIEGEVYLLADWLNSQPSEAAAWIHSNPVTDKILASTVRWTYLPDRTKIDLIQRIESPEARGDAATTLARRRAPDSGTEPPQEEELAEFQSLMAGLQAIEGIQEDTRAQLAEIAKKAEQRAVR